MIHVESLFRKLLVTQQSGALDSPQCFYLFANLITQIKLHESTIKILRKGLGNLWNGLISQDYFQSRFEYSEDFVLKIAIALSYMKEFSLELRKVDTANLFRGWNARGVIYPCVTRNEYK